MEKKKIYAEQRMEYKSAVSYLENLLEAFKAGCIDVRKQENQIILCPSSDVNIEIEAKQKRGKESFSIEISWIPSAVYKDEEDRVNIIALAPGQSEKDINDSAPVVIRAAGTECPASPLVEKKNPDEIKTSDLKNKK